MQPSNEEMLNESLDHMPSEYTLKMKTPFTERTNETLNKLTSHRDYTQANNNTLGYRVDKVL